MRTKTADGRKYKDYPREIVVRLGDEQYAHMMHHFGWMGDADYIAYFLIVRQVNDRPYAGPLTDKGKRAVARRKT